VRLADQAHLAVEKDPVALRAAAGKWHPVHRAHDCANRMLGARSVSVRGDDVGSQSSRTRRKQNSEARFNIAGPQRSGI
jgi:hypothetical protein